MEEQEVERASAAELLEGWREAERVLEPLMPGSAAWQMARFKADRARDLFHEREGDARAEHGRDMDPTPTLLPDGELLREPTG